MTIKIPFCKVWLGISYDGCDYYAPGTHGPTRIAHSRGLVFYYSVGELRTLPDTEW